MESNEAGIPVSEQELSQFLERANRLLLSVKWTPKSPSKSSKVTGVSAAPTWRESSINVAKEHDISLVGLVRQICDDPVLLAEDANHTLTVVRKALCLGMHLSKTYTTFSGLDRLIELNGRGGLAEPQKVEFRAKYHTASAIAVFASAYYVVWELSRYKADEVSNVHLELDGLAELNLQNPVQAVECMLFYFGAYLERPQLVKNSLEVCKLALLYFREVLEGISLRKDSLEYVEPFTTQHYKLEHSDFAIHGFEADTSGAEISIEFNRVSFDEIVGNRDAKHAGRRIAERLICYDPQAKKNPMQELGGLPLITMGYGEPGTGKSMLIAAVASLISDYCSQLGMPFLFWPMPDTVVSTFQGGSAERMLNWMKPLRDPGKIIYAPIDDAENNLEERSRQGVSAGVREVIAVFLRNTEGAYAVHHGNALIQLFTNLPDQIDKAVLSRINSRTYIGGANSCEDFLDQDYLWWNKFSELDSGFVGMKDPKSYQYLSSQQRLSSLSQQYGDNTEADASQIREIYNSVSQRFSSDEHMFFAELYAAVHAVYPYFTSRDVRNIQRAIDSRIMDFDMPEEWLESPEPFFLQTYERKRLMILDLMKANMKGLSFAQIRLQEVLGYLDNMVEISETGRERRIEELLDDMNLRTEAQARFTSDEGKQ